MNLSSRYLKALGLEARPIDLDFVARLQREHIRKFSFNNIGVLLGKELSLDREEITQKLISDQLGGYCFEQNKLLMEALAIVYDQEIVNWGGVYRFIKNSFGETALQLKKAEGFESLYVFDEGRYTEGDCEAGHFYSRMHPDAPFRSRLLVSAIHEHEVRCIYNANFRRSFANGKSIDQPIHSTEELASVLSQEFGIELQEEEASALYEAAVKFQSKRT